MGHEPALGAQWLCQVCSGCVWVCVLPHRSSVKADIDYEMKYGCVPTAGHLKDYCLHFRFDISPTYKHRHIHTARLFWVMLLDNSLSLSLSLSISSLLHADGGDKVCSRTVWQSYTIYCLALCLFVMFCSTVLPDSLSVSQTLRWPVMHLETQKLISFHLQYPPPLLSVANALQDLVLLSASPRHPPLLPLH